MYSGVHPSYAIKARKGANRGLNDLADGGICGHWVEQRLAQEPPSPAVPHAPAPTHTHPRPPRRAAGSMHHARCPTSADVGHAATCLDASLSGSHQQQQRAPPFHPPNSTHVAAAACLCMTSSNTCWSLHCLLPQQRHVHYTQREAGRRHGGARAVPRADPPVHACSGTPQHILTYTSLYIPTRNSSIHLGPRMVGPKTSLAPQEPVVCEPVGPAHLPTL